MSDQAQTRGHPRNPFLTVDVVVEAQGGIVLIERRNEPRGWALPGGFVDYGEAPEVAARREVLEETGLHVALRELLGIYGAPGRDPRQHNVSIVYIGSARGVPVAGDDAGRAETFSLDGLPPDLCFDHARILADYAWLRRTGERPSPTLPGELGCGDILLDAARDALASVVRHSPPSPAPAEQSPCAQTLGAAFVTLRGGDGALRGCIGEMEARRPLVQSVRANTVAAATRDPRFPPIAEHELSDLQIGISVLTPPRVISDVSALEVGRHGVVIEQRQHRGVLLPEVATEQGWDRETLLAAVCKKAGLPTDAWRHPSTVLSIFESIKLSGPATA